MKTINNIGLDVKQSKELAGDLNDEGTNALMSDFIREQEKRVWIYSAFIG